MSDLAQSYILNYLRDGTAAAVVSFEDDPHLLAPMTEISNSVVRANLASKIPTRTLGGTGIGAGLLLCQEVRKKLVKFMLQILLWFSCYLSAAYLSRVIDVL